MQESNQISLKIQFNDDIRRLAFDETCNWNNLQTTIKKLFPCETEWNCIVVKYQDEDGDMCTISSDVELTEALFLCKKTSTQRPLLRLILSKTVQVQPSQCPYKGFSGFQAGCHDWMQKKARSFELANEGIALMDEKRYKEARQKFREQLSLLRPWHKSSPLYNIACCDALLGDTSSAITFLKRAISFGFHDVEHIKSDADLDSIRDTDDYKSIIESLSSQPSRPSPPSPPSPFGCPWGKRAGHEGFKKNRDTWFQLQQKALNLLNSNDESSISEAYQLFEKQLALSEKPWHKRIPLYNMACCDALCGNTERALSHLKLSISYGYRNLRHICNDSDLASLHDLDEFKELVSSIKSGHRCSVPNANTDSTEELDTESDILDDVVETSAEVEPVIIESVIIDESPVLEFPVVESPVEACIAESVLPSEFMYLEAQVITLQEMGFMDNRANLAALLSCKGNIAKSIEKLL